MAPSKNPHLGNALNDPNPVFLKPSFKKTDLKKNLHSLTHTHKIDFNTKTDVKMQTNVRGMAKK